MADIQFNVDAALAKLGDLAAKHGPEAINAAAEVVRVNAIGQIAFGVVAAAVAIGAGIAAPKLLKLSKRLKGEHDKAYAAWRKDYSGDVEYPEDRSSSAQVGAGLTGAASFVGGILATASLFDVWAWVAMVNPKLALAHTILAKIGL